jgi:hypothetical protein
MISALKLKKIGILGRVSVILIVSLSILKPIITTALLADDLIISTYQSYVLNESWFYQVTAAVNQAIGGTHFTVLNGIISGLWVKTWIGLSVAFGINLHLGFWLAKLVIYSLWGYLVFVFIRRNAITNDKPMTILMLVILAIGFNLQIHTLWSSDPVTNFPFAGYFPVIFALIAINYFSVHLTDYSYKFFLTSSVLNVACLLIYEINISIIFYQISLIFLLKYKNKITLHELVLKLVPSAIAFSMLIIARLFAATNSQNYDGTVISITWRVLKTFLITILSSLPLSSSPMFFKLGNQMNFGINIAVFIFFLLISYVFLNSLDTRKLAKINLEIVAPLFAWGFSAAAIQAITAKIQSEVDAVGKVYTFYSTTSTVSVIFTVMLVRYALGKVNIQNAFVLIFSIIFALQVSVNYSLNNQINQFFAPNIELIKLATVPSENFDRCKKLHDWNALGWPEYYSAGVTDGLNRLSKVVNRSVFCNETS